MRRLLEVTDLLPRGLHFRDEVTLAGNVGSRVAMTVWPLPYKQ